VDALLRALFEGLGRHGAPVLAVGIFVGLALPRLADVVRPLLVPAIALGFVVALSRVDLRRLRRLAESPRTTLLLFAWLLFGAPAAMALAMEALAAPAVWRDLAVVHAAAPPVMASGAIALLLGLEVELAVLATTAATLLAPLSLALVLERGTGLDHTLFAPELALRLALFLAVCHLAAWGLRRWLGPLGLLANARLLDGFAVLGLLVFALAVMAGVGDRLREQPAAGLELLGLAFAVNVVLQALGTLLFAHHGLRVALTTGLLSGNGNLALVVAGLGNATPPDLALYVALAQFPVFLLPALQAPVYRRITRPPEE